MDKEKLKNLVLLEFKKKVPQEIAADEKRTQEFIEKNIDHQMVEQLVDEFCQKNPDDFSVLNTFGFKDAEQNEKETEESIRYKTLVNHAGLEYKKAAVDDAFDKLDKLIGN